MLKMEIGCSLTRVFPFYFVISFFIQLFFLPGGRRGGGVVGVFSVTRFTWWEIIQYFLKMEPCAQHSLVKAVCIDHLVLLYFSVIFPFATLIPAGF